MDTISKYVENIIPTLNFKFPYTAEDYVEHLYFENYHCHKDFSNTYTPDSAESIKNYAKRTHELNGKCLYSMEHGSQGNQFEVYKMAEKENLKYIHGCEAYWVKDRHEKDNANCHIILAAKNDEGRKDINFALSRANEDGFYYKPRIDLELLFDIPKNNVIVTSACIAGWNYEDAADIWLRIHEYFGNNFFFEVQNHNTDKQKSLNEKILRLSEKEGIDIICGLDSHYIDDASSVRRDQILAYKKISYPDEDGWYMDFPDIHIGLGRFKTQGILSKEQALRSFMNTNIFASSDVETIVFNRKFKIPTVYPDKTFDEKCKIYKNILSDAYKREKLKSKEKAEGIKWEAKQVIESGVPDYFLTTKAIIDDAINNEDGILTTTSRGSSASFITNKLLGITTIDRFNADIPIYPERFLTKDRVLAGQMPDADLNCASQEPFVKASKKILGEHGCYPLMAIEKLKEKAAWQLYASVSDVSPENANKISKYIDEYNKALKHADEDDKDNIRIEDFIPSEYLDIFLGSNEYRGITINLKVHACGHLLLNGDIRREIGLITAVSETTGKRTLCAAIEGGYLDEFGFVKEDYLIVDSVALTAKLFQAIGQKIPTFEELRTMIDDDQPTWDIYKNGITVCVNQCEKEATRQKVMKYQPKNLAELSSFIAAIRPGFSSLLNVFLNREPYSTGEEQIDLLLSDTHYFMIYQESIMKVLSFLNIPMNETYKVIKNISKKKYRDHPEELKALKNELITAWKEKIGNINNFDNVWNVIESSASYSFNGPHAYSMGGDSAYLAWFKAHHTKVFYEVAINHYQEKGKKDKIDALVNEAIKFYGYKLGDYRFGDDNRKVSINEEKKLIYPNMSSLKDFGDWVGEAMYQLGQNHYDNFLDLYNDMTKASMNKTIIDKLIRIGYFNKFGSIVYLQKMLEYYKLFYDMKTVSKDKVEKLDIPIDLLKEYGNETAKQFNKINGPGLFKGMCERIDDRDLYLKEILDNEFDVYGRIKYIYPKEDKRNYYVTGIDKKKTITNIELYEIFSGKTRMVKMWTNSFDKYNFAEKDIIHIIKLEKKFKREPTGEINTITGKKIYRDIPGQYEYWLQSYQILD